MKSAGKSPRLSQPITPPVTTSRPSAAMPLAYPFGTGQPLGCKICGPTPEVSSFATGTTARLGPFGMFTKSSPSSQMHSFGGHGCGLRGRPGLSHLPQGKSLQFAGFRLGQLRDEFDRTRILIRRDLALDMILQVTRQCGVTRDARHENYI